MRLVPATSRRDQSQGLVAPCELATSPCDYSQGLVASCVPTLMNTTFFETCCQNHKHITACKMPFSHFEFKTIKKHHCKMSPCSRPMISSGNSFSRNNIRVTNNAGTSRTLFFFFFFFFLNKRVVRGISACTVHERKI